MPFSSGAGKEYIREILAGLKPKKILDVGAGAGSLLKRYKRNGQQWHGVEIWQPYVEKYKLDEIYHTLTVGDAREIDYGTDRYDVAFAGDVLEHMETTEAAELLSKLRRAAQVVIVSIPIGKYPQGEYEGNPYERHVKDDWQVQDVMHILGDTKEFRVTDPVGTFIYRRDTASQKLKIAVYAIAKDEESFVEEFCKSAKGADTIIIADTGSTDDTVNLARAYGAQVHHIHISPWRFDLARNAVLALIPADIDVCISLDLDERLQPGWREEIERLWVKGVTTRLRHKFDWGQGLIFDYEKTHSRAGYHWHHPCHEYPRTDPRFIERMVTTDMLMVKHLPDNSKPRSHYIDSLWASVQEDPHCPRNAFYYARELTFNRRWDEAIEALTKYLAMPTKLWDHETAYAKRLLGDAYEGLGQPQKAMEWYRRGTADAPHGRESWYALAQACYRRNAWAEMYGATSRALEIKKRELIYTINLEAWGWQLLDLHALAAYRIGLYDVAKDYGAQALALNPGDERLKANLSFYEAPPEG